LPADARSFASVVGTLVAIGRLVRPVPIDDARLLARRLALPVVLAVLGSTSCTAVQWVDRRGEVRLLGLGDVERVQAEGGVVTRVRTPGMSLRVVTSGHRYGLGWVETTFFQSAPTDGVRELLAVGDRTYGVALDPGGLMIGGEHRFTVLAPRAAKPVVQEIRYRSGRPSADWLRRREAQ
jgi:hypothetical protein